MIERLNTNVFKYLLNKCKNIYLFLNMFFIKYLGYLLLLFFVNLFRPLGPENLLLRGARLKNTKEIFGTASFLSNLGHLESI